MLYFNAHYKDSTDFAVLKIKISKTQDAGIHPTYFYEYLDKPACNRKAINYSDCTFNDFFSYEAALKYNIMYGKLKKLILFFTCREIQDNLCNAHPSFFNMYKNLKYDDIM